MTKHQYEFPMPKLTSQVMRAMQKGDTIIVSAGHRVRTKKHLFQNQVNVTARAKQMGGVFYTKVADVVVDHECHAVVIIYCAEPAHAAKKRGRPFGSKIRPKKESTDVRRTHLQDCPLSTERTEENPSHSCDTGGGSEALL